MEAFSYGLLGIEIAFKQTPVTSNPDGYVSNLSYLTQAGIMDNVVLLLPEFMEGAFSVICVDMIGCVSGQEILSAVKKQL